MIVLSCYSVHKQRLISQLQALNKKPILTHFCQRSYNLHEILYTHVYMHALLDLKWKNIKRIPFDKSVDSLLIICV